MGTSDAPCTFRCSRARNRHWQAHGKPTHGILAANEPIRRSVGAAANARRILPGSRDRWILLPATKSSKQTRPRTLCHQQPVVCEIAGARKAASARLLDGLCE